MVCTICSAGNEANGSILIDKCAAMTYQLRRDRTGMDLPVPGGLSTRDPSR